MSEDTIVVGIDIGTDSTKVVLGATGDWACEIVRNPVGGHTTPTMVAFDGALRHLGVHAKSKRNAVQHLNRFLDQHEVVEELAQFYTVQHQCSNPDGPVELVVTVEYNQQTRDFTGAALMGMLLGQIRTDVNDTLARRQQQQQQLNNTPPLTFLISTPPDWTETAQQQLLDAAFAAGVDQTLLVDRAQAYMAAYHRKFPNHNNKTVLLVDMGHAETTLALWGPKTAEPLPNDQDNQEKQDSNPEETHKPTLLAGRRQMGLGAGMVDAALWHHFQSNTPQLAGLTPPSRGGQRLLAGMNKLKHLLSQLPEATVTVENLVNDQDMNLAAHRTLLEEVCQSQLQLLTNSIQQIISNKTIDAVEVVGGACRIPCFQNAIQEATQSSTLSFSLDDTSAALGATLLGVDQPQTTTEVGPAQMALRQAEQEMAALDRDQHQRAALLNQLEAHILELQSARSGPHADLLQHPQLFDYLTQLEDWMFSQEAQDATTEQLAQKWEQIKAQTDEWTKEYRAALEEEQRTKEAELERQAQQAQLERNGQENEEEDDHDNRRLPKKRRMEIVMKNKKEGGELFSDGNYKFAAARYAKALSHCAKFVDLSPDDIQEVNAVKLTLNLNLALAYLKLQKPEQALRCCNDALALDDQHTKALYRRASVYYEQKNWEAASKDLKKARKQEPEDKAISKLQERVDAQIKRQQLKEKKMAKKMFG